MKVNKILAAAVSIMLVLILPVAAYAQGPPNQTIEQVLGLFPASINANVDNESGRLLLRAIVQNEKIIWPGPENKVTFGFQAEHLFEVVNTQAIDVKTKGYLTPIGARITNEAQFQNNYRELDNLQMGDGIGQYGFDNLEKPGIYGLHVIVSDQDGKGMRAIYEAQLEVEGSTDDRLLAENHIKMLPVSELVDIATEVNATEEVS